MLWDFIARGVFRGGMAALSLSLERVFNAQIAVCASAQNSGSFGFLLHVQRLPRERPGNAGTGYLLADAAALFLGQSQLLEFLGSFTYRLKFGGPRRCFLGEDIPILLPSVFRSFAAFLRIPRPRHLSPQSKITTPTAAGDIGKIQHLANPELRAYKRRRLEPRGK